MARARQGIKIKRVRALNKNSRYTMKYSYNKSSQRTNNRQSSRYSYSKRINRKRYSYS